MKKILIVLIILILLVGGFFIYVNYKKSNLKQDVVEYLTVEENVAKDDIISSEPFISNLRGSKNYMVSIKLKNDDKTYYYYKENGEIILESYVENGREYIQE